MKSNLAYPAIAGLVLLLAGGCATPHGYRATGMAAGQTLGTTSSPTSQPELEPPLAVPSSAASSKGILKAERQAAIAQHARAASAIGKFKYIKTLDAGGSPLDLFATAQYEASRKDQRLDPGPVIIVNASAGAQAPKALAGSAAVADATLESNLGSQAFTAKLEGDPGTWAASIEAQDGYVEFVGNNVGNPDVLRDFVEGYVDAARP